MQNIRINPQSMSYNIDIVFCIDISDSMTPIINQVKENAKQIPEIINQECTKKGKKVKNIRLKLIQYCNMYNEEDPGRLITGEFTENGEEFFNQVDSIKTTGGNAVYDALENKYELYPHEFRKLANESTLDAILFACESDWYKESGKSRKVIIAMTDEPAGVIHPESLKPGEQRGVNTVINRYLGISLSNEARLLIIGPECEDFTALSQAEFTQYIKSSPGNGLEEIGFYETVIPWLVNSI